MTPSEPPIAWRVPRDGLSELDNTPEWQAKSDAYEALCSARQDYAYHLQQITAALARRRPDGTWAPEDAELTDYAQEFGLDLQAAMADARQRAQAWRADYHVFDRQAEEIEADAVAELANNLRSRRRTVAELRRMDGLNVPDPDDHLPNPTFAWYQPPAHEADPEFRYWSPIRRDDDDDADDVTATDADARR